MSKENDGKDDTRSKKRHWRSQQTRAYKNSRDSGGRGGMKLLNSVEPTSLLPKKEKEKYFNIILIQVDLKRLKFN